MKLHLNLIIFAVFFACCGVLNAQTNNAQPLNYRANFWSAAFEQNGIEVTSGYVKDRFKEKSPLALDLYKQGKSNEISAYVLAGLSGGLIGLTSGLGSTLEKGRQTTNYVIGGLGIVTSLIVGAKGNSKYKQATKAYNDAIGIPAPKTSFKVGATNNGIGIALNF